MEDDIVQLREELFWERRAKRGYQSSCDKYKEKIEELKLEVEKLQKKNALLDQQLYDLTNAYKDVAPQPHHFM